MVSVYIHIPFCLKRCFYCDFTSFSKINKTIIDKYINALCFEISKKPPNPLKGEYKNKIKSIYFGGGTPSLLSISQLKIILSELKKNFNILSNCEITLEINPATVSIYKLKKFRKLGINRLSLGLQSFDNKLLKKSGRLHNITDNFNVIHQASLAAFKNVSIDLIYGLPNQSLEIWKRDLQIVCELVSKDLIKHVSIYALSIHEDTVFGKKYINSCHKALPTEKEICDMYNMACEMLNAYNFEHYEISNFAKKGYESVHNLTYWNMEEFYGFGLSSHEYRDFMRKANTSNLQEYLENPLSYEILESNTIFDEFMLKLRLAKGLNILEFTERHNLKNTMSFESLEKYIKEDLLLFKKNTLKLTEKGFLVSNSLINELYSMIGKGSSAKL